MQRHLKTVLKGTISLIEKPSEKVYRFAIDVEQRYVDIPAVNPIAIYGTLDYDLSLNRVTSDTLSYPYKTLLNGTKHQILTKINETIDDDLKRII
ncbi:hypothetical protein D1B31_18355 [Neobacillus notoginsengisoli]|uniref:Uncharacterized protein n=1 Tax=Neobacillus notoginsengisoli TaxID=1578198 RepID=A0A417YQP7_9BACI|nr:hypothetical protein [Neobacillus notoginsengisoli]RHW36046.1 hypothetical protein D1B31_18355 [Neobacillus notoginsengisoli]